MNADSLLLLWMKESWLSDNAMKVWFILGIFIVAALALQVTTTVSSGLNIIIEKIAEAIKQFEGWSVGSKSYRNNNPGNLKYTGQTGEIGKDTDGEAIFDSYQSGWNALIRQIEMAFTGESAIYSITDNFYTFFSKYAEGNSQQYAEYVASYVGVSPQTTFAELLGA